MSQKFTIICKDNESIEVDTQIASFSVKLKGFIDDGWESTQDPIPYRRPILEKIMEFCTYLIDHAPPEI